MKKVKSAENSYFLPIFILLNSHFLSNICEKNSYFPIFLTIPIGGQPCSGKCMCSVAGILIQGHGPVMWNACIPS